MSEMAKLSLRIKRNFTAAVIFQLKSLFCQTSLFKNAALVKKLFFGSGNIFPLHRNPQAALPSAIDDIKI
ncbi:MAG: hypothetical protein WD059_00150 [Balneolaceae bacterium]